MALLLVAGAALGLQADTILFDDRIDSQQKTEIRYDVPDGCIITGLGFRANYDNITTMHVRYHRLNTTGTLTDPVEVQLGSEPNHACEAKILLPDGYVAVGFGAAGEPEWDVTLLRIWARQLRSDGSLGDVKTFSNGFKPDREPEREAVVGGTDRVLTGAGLRFASNDIGGIYARSKRIISLTNEDRKKLGNITTRAWAVDPSTLEDIDRLVRDIKKYGINRLDVDYFRSRKGFLQEHLASFERLCADVPQLQIYLTVYESSYAEVLRRIKDTPAVTGIVIDMSFYHPGPPDPGRGPVWDPTKDIQEMQRNCSRAGKALNMHFNLVFWGAADSMTPSFAASMPKEVGIIIPIEFMRLCRIKLGRTPQFDARQIIVEVDLAPHSTRAAPLPDVRIDQLPGYLLEASLGGATGVLVPIYPDGVYLPDTINNLNLDALYKLADNPLQSVDVIWNDLCTARYGPAADYAISALKRTPAINDLLFDIFGREGLWLSPRVLTIDPSDHLKSYANLRPPGATTEFPWYAPDKKTVELAMQEKETAFWLLAQSIPDANQAVKANPTGQTRELLDAMLSLRSAAQFWRDVTQAYLYTKTYAIDGAPSTRASVESALARLRDPTKYGVIFAGTAKFVRSAEESLAKSQKGALFIRSLNSVRRLSAEGKDEAAAKALLDILNSEMLASHLSKQNQAIGEIASSLKAFGELTSNITVMRHGDGSWGIEKVAGRWSWAIGPGRPCLYLDFLPGRLETPADYILSFEYFDKGDWTIHCHYDSAYPPDDKREYHPVEPLQLTDTKTWKEGSFLLTNCRFASRQNDRADMRFVTGSGAAIRNIRLAPAPTGSIDKENGKRLFYRILGSQSNSPYVRKTRTVAAPDYLPRTATTGMADAGYTEYPFCFGNWSITFREREGLFPRFATSLAMDPTRVNTCDILVDWVYEPDACVWGPACSRFGQTFVTEDTELVAVTLLVASPRGTFHLSVHETGPDGALVAPRKQFTSGHSMEWATVRYAPGQATLQPGKTYYIKILRQDGKPWNPYFHSTGNAYDKGCAYFDDIKRPESDLALWITTEPPDVSRAVVLDTESEGWTKAASGFRFVPRTPNIRMITVRLKPVGEFCVRPVTYIWQLEPERKLICGPKYTHACARPNTSYEAGFLFGPGELPCKPGKKYYAEIFTVPFEQGKETITPQDRSNTAEYEILASVYGETVPYSPPVLYNLAADPSKHSTLQLTYQLSKPADVQIEILEPNDIAKTIDIPAGSKTECRVFGLGPGDDCDFRLTAFDPDHKSDPSPCYSRPTPLYRVKIPGGEPAKLLWPETPEFFVPLAPRPELTSLCPEPKPNWRQINIPDGDFESDLGAWTEDKTGIGGVSPGDAQIKPPSGTQMYGWTHRAARERKDVFLENAIYQTVPTKPGRTYILTARAITAVTNGTRGDTRIRLAVDPTAGGELKGKNSSQWFWTDGKWMTFSHEFTAESEKATIAIAFFRWRDLDRADAYIDNIRLYDLGSKP